MYKILIADDEGIVVQALEYIIQKNFGSQCEVLIAKNGRQAIELAEQHRPDIALMDIQMPGINGLKALEEIHARDPKIKTFITKPFSMPVLLQKIRVILRRSGGMEGEECLRYRGLTLHLESREALLEGRPVALTAREFELLHTFLAAPGRVFTREMLLAKLWGYDFYGDERVVDSHIKNLRHKLGQGYIETVRGVGYRAAKEDR